MLPIKIPKKYLGFTILAALLFFCIGLYGIHLMTRKVEAFSALGGSCEGNICSGETPYCLVTERALPDNTIDQTLIFNTVGRYVQIVPPEKSGDGVVQLSQILVYDSKWTVIGSNRTLTNIALNKPVTASCTQPNVLIGLPKADSVQLVQVPRSYARYVRIRPSSTSDGVMNIRQIKILNKSGDNYATASTATVYATTTTGRAISTIIDGTSTTPKPYEECWTSNKDTTFNAEYVEIDLGSGDRPISSIEYIGPTGDTNNRILGLRFELSMYSLRNGGTSAISNSLTVDGTLATNTEGALKPRDDPSKVCMLGDGRRDNPVWEVDLGEAKFITSVRYIGRADSGDDMNDPTKNSLPGPRRNEGVRIRVLKSKTEVATKGRCDKLPDTSVVPYPVGTTAQEKIILEPYILKGIDLTMARCILNKIQKNATPDNLIECGLTEFQVVQGFVKMRYKNIQLENTGFTTSGSWLSDSTTITITGGIVPSVGMTIANTPTPIRSVLWSISGATVTSVNGKTITIDKTTTDTNSRSASGVGSGTLGNVTFKMKPIMTDSTFATEVAKLKGLKTKADLKFNTAECMTKFKKNHMTDIDTTPTPTTVPYSGSGSGFMQELKPSFIPDDGSKAATDIFVEFLIPTRRDPSATYSQSLTDTNTPTTDDWALTAITNLSVMPPPKPTPTDAQIDQIAAEFSIDRMTVPRSDMDNAAGNTTSSYVPLTPGEASSKKVGPQVFFVGGKFASKEVAEKICKDMNAELATPIQLKNAWRRGAQWCEPGWVSMSPAQASEAKAAIDALIVQWDSSSYKTHIAKYNELKAKKRVYGTNGEPARYPYATGIYNPKDFSMFYDQTGEGFWLPLASTYIVELTGKADLRSLSRDYPWLKTYEIRYGYEPGWKSRIFSDTLITNIDGILDMNSVALKNLFPSDPHPGSDYKYLELKVNEPKPGFDLKGYKNKKEMEDDLKMIGDVQAGLTLKQFPAQIPDTDPKPTKPRGLTAFQCVQKKVCPSGRTAVAGQPMQCCPTYNADPQESNMTVSVDNNMCKAKGQKWSVQVSSNMQYITEQVSKDLGAPTPPNTVYTNCVCPTGYVSEMNPPISLETVYNTEADIPQDKCRSNGPCDTGYSPFKMITGGLSTKYCVKDTCEKGYVEDASGQCVQAYYAQCGNAREIVDKSSTAGGVGAVCFGPKPSQIATTVSLPNSDLTQTYELNKKGRYVRIWPATKANASISYIERFQVGVDAEARQLTTPTNTVSAAPTVPPSITCRPGFRPVAVSNVNNNTPTYICVTQECEPGYKRTDRGCVYESWLSLSQIVIKDAAGNNISQGKPVYAFPGSEEGKPENLVNGTERVLNTLDATNGWLSQVYFDGELDTFIQIDLQDNIDIGTVTIYGNTSTKGPNGAPPIMKGVRIELSKYPRALPFSDYKGTDVWNDMGAYTMQDCPKNFYRKDCDNGLGPVCIIDGMGCSNECPPGLVRDTKGGDGKPPSYGCIFDIHNLDNYQKLSRLGVDKSDYYKLGGTFDDDAYTAALVNAYKTTQNTWYQVMQAMVSSLTSAADLSKCQQEVAKWKPNSVVTNQNVLGVSFRCGSGQGIPGAAWGLK